MPPAVKTAREGPGQESDDAPNAESEGKNQGSLVGLGDLHHWSGGLLPNPATRVSFSMRSSLCCTAPPLVTAHSQPANKAKRGAEWVTTAPSFCGV